MFSLQTAPEVSWRRVFYPCAPLLFDLYHYLEQNGYFWLVPEHAPGPSIQVLPGYRVRHPCYPKKLFVRCRLSLCLSKELLCSFSLRRLHLLAVSFCLYVSLEVFFPVWILCFVLGLCRQMILFGVSWDRHREWKRKTKIERTFIGTAYCIWSVIASHSPMSIYLVSFQRNVAKKASG